MSGKNGNVEGVMGGGVVTGGGGAYILANNKQHAQFSLFWNLEKERKIKLKRKSFLCVWNMWRKIHLLNSLFCLFIYFLSNHIRNYFLFLRFETIQQVDLVSFDIHLLR